MLLLILCMFFAPQASDKVELRIPETTLNKFFAKLGPYSKTDTTRGLDASIPYAWTLSNLTVQLSDKGITYRAKCHIQILGFEFTEDVKGKAICAHHEKLKSFTLKIIEAKVPLKFSLFGSIQDLGVLDLAESLPLLILGSLGSEILKVPWSGGDKHIQMNTRDFEIRPGHKQLLIKFISEFSS